MCESLTILLIGIVPSTYYIQTGAIVLQPRNPFDHVERPKAIRYLDCSGSESNFSECNVTVYKEKVNTCGRYEVAGIVCQSKNEAYFINVQLNVLRILQSQPPHTPFPGNSTRGDNCTYGSVRLVGEDIDDDGVSAREGRVEVCINHAWGTVCNQHFTQGDAEVVCGQLDGFYKDGKNILVEAISVTNNLIAGAMVRRPSPGSGPVFLQGLSCDGNESSLMACEK